ncbi:hypothetical protein [Streptomyces sp. NPDC056160]|uniref:hypothetical protein n=1 Tax=Streptomyces sp. NPDC056160 TaxID=3345731 RepID=UPI0035DE0C84
MPATVKAFGARDVRQPPVPVTVERRDVGPHDVWIGTLHCGICRCDPDFVSGGFGPLPVRPLVTGHGALHRRTCGQQGVEGALERLPGHAGPDDHWPGRRGRPQMGEHPAGCRLP